MTRLAALIALLATSAAAADGIEGDAAYGQYLFGECTACHSAEGSGAIPVIHGMDAEGVVAMLNAYKNGEIDHAAMRSVTRSLGDAEIAALAVYIAALEPSAPKD